MPVVGTEGGREFTRVLIGNELDDGRRRRRAGHPRCRRRLGARATPSIGAVLLECTNMVPYARALRERLRLPVYDIYSFVTWFHAGLAPRDFGHPGSGARAWRER